MGTLTSVSATELMESACAEIGISSAGARLMRLGENALFHIPESNLVVRIARGPDFLEDARKEVRVAAWLEANNVDALRASTVDQPIVVHDHPITFWRYIPNSGVKASAANLGRVLRQIHSLSAPSSLELPRFRIFGRVEPRLDRANGVEPDDLEFLRDRLSVLRRSFAELEARLETVGPVHGDAHVQNLIVRPDRVAVLIDFDGFALGAPETDLCVTATEHEIGWHTDTEYAGFCEAYGRDVTSWPGFSVLKQINQLKMTTWLMQNIANSAEVKDEFKVRLATLRDGKAPRPWRPF